MNKPRNTARVGKEQLRGLSIVVEGRDDSFVSEVTNRLKKLLPKGIELELDDSFANRGEEVIRETIQLYQTVRAPIDAKTKSLLYIVAYAKRIERIQRAKKEGKLALTNSSWLEDYRRLLELGDFETATHLFETGLGVKPDVWVVLDQETRLYKRLKEHKLLRVITASNPEDAALRIYSYIHSELQKKKQASNTKPEQQQSDETPTLSHDAKEDRPRLPKLPDGILKAYTTIFNRLESNYRDAVTNKIPNAHHIKPFGLFENTPEFTSKVESAAYEPAKRSVTVISHTPRNERDIASHTMFRVSGVEHEISYEEASKLVESIVYEHAPESELLSYELELVTTLDEALLLRNQLRHRYCAIQTPSVYLGYDIDEDAPRSFQESFDLALELYSLLQAAECFEACHFACLGGHFVRLRVAVSVIDLQRLLAKLDKQTKSILIEKISEIHPITGNVLKKVTELKKPRA